MPKFFLNHPWECRVPPSVPECATEYGVQFTPRPAAGVPTLRAMSAVIIEVCTFTYL